MTTTDETLLAASELLKPYGGTESRPEPNRPDLNLPVERLLGAVAALRTGEWGCLAAITGLDSGTPAGHLEVLYHFCEASAVVTLRVDIPRSEPTVPSLASLVPSAGLYERELSEMLGITVSDSPNSDRLYLPDDWPANLYPLRKDAMLAGPSAESG